MCEAFIEQRCQTCGSVVQCRTWEHVIGGRLQWVVLCGCGTCGGGETEEFGWDETPAQVRQALLDTCGTFRLRVQAPQQVARMPVMRVLRATGEPLASVSARVEALMTQGQTGTEAELELLALRLAEVGVPTTTARDDQG
ncbi:hypothetical protein [Phytohabitans houttuyneae]|uniref:Uncharacterized protein n=1 Tax=Phytohabitans houttuyneae TaxID=1076126 RepID=A0A6V8KMH0_9ACTN|nr:hypothetical protein [Phytohabitans houttuyneae]GFJ83611.1 hypothetical protein Phou_077910 [Phytohabitans houttuyneae]